MLLPLLRQADGSSHWGAAALPRDCSLIAILRAV